MRTAAPARLPTTPPMTTGVGVGDESELLPPLAASVVVELPVSLLVAPVPAACIPPLVAVAR